MFQSLLDTTDAAILDFVFDIWTRFNAVANNWLTAMMVLFVVVMGYMLLVGRIQISIGELFPRVFKLLFIFVLVTNVGVLTALVYSTFTEIPESIATFLVTEIGTSQNGVNGVIENVWDRGMVAAQNIFDQGGMTNWGPWMFAGLVAGVTIAAIVYVSFLLMLSKLAVAVLLAVAPFFIVMYLFDALRPVFEGWVRQVISFALIPVFLYALLALIFGIANQVSETLLQATQNEAASLTQVAPFAVVMLVSLLLATQVQGWAAGVGGGFSLSTLGALGAATRYAAHKVSGGGTRAYEVLRERLSGRGRTEMPGQMDAARYARSAASLGGQQKPSQNNWEDRNRRGRTRS